MYPTTEVDICQLLTGGSEHTKLVPVAVVLERVLLRWAVIVVPDPEEAYPDNGAAFTNRKICSAEKPLTQLGERVNDASELIGPGDSNVENDTIRHM